MSTQDRIAALNDAHAVRLLRRAAQGLPSEPPASPQELRPALPSPPEASPSEGDLARAALHVLAETSPHDQRIEALLDAPQPETFEFASGIAIITLAIVALQTNVEFTRDKDGRWDLKISKPTASDAVIKKLLDAISGWTRK